MNNQNELALADWLDQLAVFGAPRRFHDAETAYHLSQAIKHWHLVKLAIEPGRIVDTEDHGMADQ